MTATVEINKELWSNFTVFAQQKRKRPNRLLENLIAEYLAIQNDLQLDEAIRQQATKSGFKENDAVELVRQYRKMKAA
jgi:hypothetical protein